MEIYKPYLVQRCNIKQNLSDKKKFSDNIETQYMGSAEFEFGALPRSLREINARINEYSVIEVNEIKNLQGRPLLVWTNIPADEISEYIENLIALREGQNVRTKESTGFTIDSEKQFAEGKRTYGKTDFWWDIDNNVMFSFNPDVMQILTESVKVSIAYMDEARIKAAKETTSFKYNA